MINLKIAKTLFTLHLYLKKKKRHDESDRAGLIYFLICIKTCHNDSYSFFSIFVLPDRTKQLNFKSSSLENNSRPKVFYFTTIKLHGKYYFIYLFFCFFSILLKKNGKMQPLKSCKHSPLKTFFSFFPQ